jgi:putative Mn2+ efflux pump MntP
LSAIGGLRCFYKYYRVGIGVSMCDVIVGVVITAAINISIGVSIVIGFISIIVIGISIGIGRSAMLHCKIK